MSLYAKRHYISIAETLRSQADTHDLFSRVELDQLVDRFVILFERDNPRFRLDQFRKAVYRDGVD